MNPNRQRSSIFPGRRMLSSTMALFSAGLDVDQSYLNESRDESVEVSQSTGMEEKEWRRQGLTEKEVFERLEERTRAKHSEAEENLRSKMRGAQNFSDLLEKYSVKKTRMKLKKRDDTVLTNNENITAGGRERRGTMSTDSSSMSVNGIAFSTPRNGKEGAMQILKQINISHLVNASDLDMSGKTIHNAKVTINLSENCSQLSTKTLQSVLISSELQKTFTIPHDHENSSLLRTFTVKEEVEDDGTLQGTFVVRRDSDEEKNTTLQKTYVISGVPTENDTSKTIEEDGDIILGKILQATPKVSKTFRRLSILSNSAQNSLLLSDSKMENQDSVPDGNEGMTTPTRKSPEYDGMRGRSTLVEISRHITTTPSRISTVFLSSYTPTKSHINQIFDSSSLKTDETLENSSMAYIRSRSSDGMESSEEMKDSGGEKLFSSGDEEGEGENFCKIQTTGLIIDEEENFEYIEEPDIELIEEEDVTVVDDEVTFHDSKEEQEIITSSASENYTDEEAFGESSVKTHENSDTCDGENGQNSPTASKRIQSTKSKKFTRWSFTKFVVVTPALNRKHKKSHDEEETRDESGEHQLQKRELIVPEQSQDGLRRSTRCRVAPLRWWLGELATYKNSPSGGRRLVGVTDVIFPNNKITEYGTVDPKLAAERRFESKTCSMERRRLLARAQKFGERLNKSQEDIITSSDEE